MDIKIGDKVVGSIYINIQMDLASFEGKSFIQIIDLIKGDHGQTQQEFDLNIGKFKITSFRRIYNDTDKLCIEGAILEPVV